MARCSAITKAGDRCKAGAMEGSDFCWNHRPDTAEARSRNATKGGKTGGRGRPARAELDEAKVMTRVILRRLLGGEIERDVATAMFMGLNTYSRQIELGMKVRLEEEFEDRLRVLEGGASGEPSEARRGA